MAGDVVLLFFSVFLQLFLEKIIDGLPSGNCCFRMGSDWNDETEKKK